MNPRYDLPAPWSASVSAAPSAASSASSGSMNWIRWCTCLSLRRESWFRRPSGVRICSSLSNSTDCPGRSGNGPASMSGTARARPAFGLIARCPGGTARRARRTAVASSAAGPWSGSCPIGTLVPGAGSWRRPESGDDVLAVRPPPPRRFIVVAGRRKVAPVRGVDRHELGRAEHREDWHAGHQFLQQGRAQFHILRVCRLQNRHLVDGAAQARVRVAFAVERGRLTVGADVLFVPPFQSNPQIGADRAGLVPVGAGLEVAGGVLGGENAALLLLHIDIDAEFLPFI